MESWTTRVERYVDQLQQLTERWYGQLEALEQKVAALDKLLRAADAPEAGMTLTEKLRYSNHPELAQRADHFAHRIADVHGQSMSIFVCQFHLYNLTTDLVRMLTGAEQTTTYG